MKTIIIFLLLALTISFFNQIIPSVRLYKKEKEVKLLKIIIFGLIDYLREDWEKDEILKDIEDTFGEEETEKKMISIAKNDGITKDELKEQFKKNVIKYFDNFL